MLEINGIFSFILFCRLKISALFNQTQFKISFSLNKSFQVEIKSKIRPIKNGFTISRSIRGEIIQYVSQF